MLNLLKYFKKAAKFKGKVKRSKESGEQVDTSIYRIGLFGHTNVGKTVFLTAAYAFSENSPDFQLLAMGDTQVYLEENFIMMKGLGGQDPSGKSKSPKFPGTTFSDRKLSFSAQLGKSMNVPLETLDYSGKNVYIDSPMGIQQNLMDFFHICDCVLFLIDFEAINNESELAKRVSSFTQVIKQLSGSKRHLDIPIGLVITKADELPGFKSGLLSTLIRSEAGYIKGMRFNDFLSKVAQQQYLADYPEWKNNLKTILVRLQSFFIPLIKSTLDYQVFFVSSTGNLPETVSSQSGVKSKIPPPDFRPLGVTQPIEWALKRIRACKRGVILNKILKWFVFAAVFSLLIVSSLNVYNKTKIDSLINNISELKLDRFEAYNDLNSMFDNYSNNIILRIFFDDFVNVAREKYEHFANLSDDGRMQAQFQRFNMVKDSTNILIATASDRGSDSISYKIALSDMDKLITMAGDLERSLKTQGYETDWMLSDINSWKEVIEKMPSVEDHSGIFNLIMEYNELKQDFNANLSNNNYTYLLDLSDNSQFPGKLSQLNDKLAQYADVPGVPKYSQKTENYINSARQLQKQGEYIFFTVSGADPNTNGYYLTFAQQAGFPEGDLDVTSRERIRVPANSDIEIKLHHVSKVTAIDNCVIPAGFDILSWNNKKLCFKDQSINIRLRFDLDEFESLLKNEL